MYSDKQLFKSIFLVQIFAAFLVTLGHYTAGLGSFIEITRWEEALNQISRYGTVLLAMITGFFTAHSFYGKEATAGPFFKGKLVYIFIPFILAGFVYHFILIGGTPTKSEHFVNIMLGKTGMHLYFVFMLCQYYVLAYLLRNIVTSKNIHYFLLLFMVVQFAFIQSNFYWNGLGVRHFVPTWIFTIYLGHLLYGNREKVVNGIFLKKWVRPLLVILALINVLLFALTENLYTANHLRFVFSTALLLAGSIALLLPLIDKIGIKFHKGLTYYIYLAHPLFIIYVNKLTILKFGWTNWLANKWFAMGYLLFIFMVTYLFAWMLAVGIEKISQARSQRRKTQQIQTVSS